MLQRHPRGEAVVAAGRRRRTLLRRRGAHRAGPWQQEAEGRLLGARQGEQRRLARSQQPRLLAAASCFFPYLSNQRSIPCV